MREWQTRRTNIGRGGYVVFELRAGEAGADNALIGADDQQFTDKVYNDITVSLGTGKAADVVASLEDQHAIIDGPCPTDRWGHWQCFMTKVGRVGVLPLPLAGLVDGALVHRLDAPEGTFDHHILLYYADGRARAHAGLALMKLRAIEHRAAVALFADDHREVVKTTKYKNIQRFSEKDGVFGLNAESLGGTWSTARDDKGIFSRWFPFYRSLLQPDR